VNDSDLQELQKETFVVVDVLVGFLATAYVLLLLMSTSSVFTLRSLWWIPAGLAAVTSFGAFALYRRNKFRLATYVFVAGLAVAVVSWMVYVDHLFFERYIYWLMLVVALAGLLINPRAALHAANFSALVTVTATIARYGLTGQIFSWLFFPLMSVYCMAIISGIGSSHLTATLRWAFDSQARAQERSRELFNNQLELKKAYQLLETTNVRLQQAEAAARQASQFKTRFITNLSHELRTPLSAIINFSYILAGNQHGPVTNAQREYLNRIQDAGELLLDIVNDLLDLAKIEAGQMDLFIEPIDLQALGASVVNTTSGLVTDKPVTLEKEFSPNLPIIYADSTRVRQILLNLMGNAAKYTDTGSIRLRMVENGADSVLISVVDTGIGIRPQDFEAIFEEFRQTDDAFALRKVGTGLGLPISKKFAELHGGNLWVESVYGQGATFHLSLPVNNSAQTTQANGQEVVIL
jgi:signal transduction histidine kinase